MGGLDGLPKRDVEELDEKKDVEGLTRALQHVDANVRAGTARALGEIRSERAVRPLIDALRDTNELVRWAAAGALGQIGDTRAVGPLVLAADDPGCGEGAIHGLQQLLERTAASFAPDHLRAVAHLKTVHQWEPQGLDVPSVKRVGK